VGALSPHVFFKVKDMPTQKDLEQALEIATTEFLEKDPEGQAKRSGAHWIPSQGTESHPRTEIPFLGTWYQILLPNGEVLYRDTHEQPALWERILILHYFNRADGSPLTGQLISFGEIPEGRIYSPAFEKRVTYPLLARYGACPEEILGPALCLQGVRMDIGDIAVRIPLLPQVPVILVFWKQDEEFAARVTILFDRSVTRYLPTEDIVLASQMMALSLQRH